jgi:hypothetical protein
MGLKKLKTMLEKMVERIEILEKTIERTEAESVTSILNRADEFGLTHEVLHSAFEHLRQFPTASVKECLQVGAREWDI